MATQKRHALCGNLLRLQEAFAGVKPASYVGTGCFERSWSRGRRWICVRSRGTANTENFTQQSNRNNTFLLVKLCAATTATIPCKARWYATSSNRGWPELRRGRNNSHGRAEKWMGKWERSSELSSMKMKASATIDMRLYVGQTDNVLDTLNMRQTLLWPI